MILYYYKGQLGEMVVGWLTGADTATSIVQYWEADHPENVQTQNGEIYHYYMVIPIYESPAIHCTHFIIV